MKEKIYDWFFLCDGCKKSHSTKDLRALDNGLFCHDCYDERLKKEDVPTNNA